MIGKDCSDTWHAFSAEGPGKIRVPRRSAGRRGRWLLVHAAPIRNEQGEVYRIAGVGLDVRLSQVESALEESGAIPETHSSFMAGL